VRAGRRAGRRCGDPSPPHWCPSGRSQDRADPSTGDLVDEVPPCRIGQEGSQRGLEVTSCRSAGPSPGRDRRKPPAHGIRHRPRHVERSPSAQVRTVLELTASFLVRLGRRAQRIFCPHGCGSCLCRPAACGAVSIVKLAGFSPGCAHAATAWCTGCPQDVHKPWLSRRVSGHTVTH
jgi:hypothetical protein